MTADEIEKQQARLAAAKPFAELEEIMLNLEGYANQNAGYARGLLHEILGGGLAYEPELSRLRESILQHHADLVARLNAVTERVMKHPLLDKDFAPMPPDGPLEETPMAKETR